MSNTEPILAQTEVRTLPDRQPRRIAAAAILCGQQVFSLPAPARHHDVLHEMSQAGLARSHGEMEQGFITEDGYWLRRAPALYIAEKAGQIVRRTHPSLLFSEDLW